MCGIGPIGVSYVAYCPPTTNFVPYYWWTRYPVQKSKIFNVLNLFSPESWLCTFLVIISTVVSLKLATHVGVKLGLSTSTDDIILFPFRSIILYYEIIKREHIYIFYILKIFLDFQF